MNHDEHSASIVTSLNATLDVLKLEPRDENRFEVSGTQGMFDRTYGGQLLWQSVVAASATVPGKFLHSLHGYFIRASDPREALRIHLERLRDGRSMATQMVNIMQQNRVLFCLLASFHQSQPSGEWQASSPALPDIEDCPTIQPWAANAPDHLAASARTWIDNPPPAEMQIAAAQAGPLKIELIQDLGDAPSVLREALGEGKSVVHQLCTVTRNYEGKKAHDESLGCPVACELSGPMRDCYVDTVDDFGYFTEIVEYSDSFHKQLNKVSDTCRDWNGEDPVRILTREGYTTP